MFRDGKYMKLEDRRVLGGKKKRGGGGVMSLDRKRDRRADSYLSIALAPGMQPATAAPDTVH